MTYSQQAFFTSHSTGRMETWGGTLEHDRVVGIVESLTILPGQRNFFRRNSAWSAEIGKIFSVQEEEFSTMEHFTCVISKRFVAGCFSKITFAEGDAIEVVGEIQVDGTLAAVAVRRPSDHTIWTIPFCWNGTHQRMMSSLQGCFFGLLFRQVVIAAPIGLSLLFFDYSTIHTVVAITLSSISVLIFLCFSIFEIIPKNYVKMTDCIFELLGYSKPANVDLHRDDFNYWHRKGEETFLERPPRINGIFKYVTDDLNHDNIRP